MDDFKDSPIQAEVLPLIDDDCCYCCHGLAMRRARGMHLFSPIEVEFKWRSSDVHTVKRVGFPLTHANYLTSTASQGQTIRTGVTIDCARLVPAGRQGMKDSEWWHPRNLWGRILALSWMQIQGLGFRKSGLRMTEGNY